MPEELRALWTLTAEELKQAGGERDANALAFAVLLKFFQVHGRFPRGRAEIPDEVVRFVWLCQVDVTASDLGFYGDLARRRAVVVGRGRPSRGHRLGDQDCPLLPRHLHRLASLAIYAETTFDAVAAASAALDPDRRH